MTPDTNNNRNYGMSPRCSPLQQEWQTSHAVFKAVGPKLNVKSLLSSSPLL